MKNDDLDTPANSVVVKVKNHLPFYINYSLAAPSMPLKSFFFTAGAIALCSPFVVHRHLSTTYVIVSDLTLS